jgi:hypothetical protein
LPCLKGHPKKLHSELFTLNPFDRAEFNGQRRRLIREQDTHAHVATAKNFSIA